MDDPEDEAPGWDAISSALGRIYGDQEPLHVGTVLKYMVGGPDPLDGISIYRADEPKPHWHFVSYGLSELYVKESEDLEESGWGFEFTFRLARDVAEDSPPSWVFSLLQNLARYVFNTGNVFGPGHKMNLNGPIALGSDTLIRAIAFVNDRQLPPIDTPHGRLAFLQIVGLTLDEHEAVSRWDAERFLDLLAKTSPLGLTDLSRECFMTDEQFRSQVEEGIQRDGSSQEMIAVGHLEVAVSAGVLTVSIGANAVAGLRNMLEGRLLHDRGFLIVGRLEELVLEPGDAVAFKHDPEGLTSLTLSRDQVQGLLGSLEPKRGAHDFGVWVLKIVPSQIKDAEGNIVRTVG